MANFHEYYSRIIGNELCTVVDVLSASILFIKSNLRHRFGGGGASNELYLLCALHRYVYKIFLRCIKVMATGEML